MEGTIAPQHFHAYRVVNRSQYNFGTGMRWIERCKCGASVQCEHGFAVGGNKAGTVKVWFDREGNLQRTTGKINAESDKPQPDESASNEQNQ